MINDEIIGRNDEIYLMECLALTYEEKANFNNKLIDDNAILFNKALKKLRFFSLPRCYLWFWAFLALRFC